MRGARHFLEGFLPEWLGGAPTHVRIPLGQHEVQTAVHLMENSGIADRVIEQRTRLARRIWSAAPTVPFTPHDLRLAAVVHNLLALGHPALGRSDARPGGGAASARFTARLLESIDRPQDLQAAVAAHTLVGRLFEAERNDAEVTTWLTTYRFRGRPVPANITRFRALRRVRVHGRRVEGVGLLESEDQFILLDRLLLRSPVTDLLHADRSSPPFRLAGLARWLGDADLCRAVVYRWVERDRPAEVAEALSQALFVRARGLAPEEEIALVAHALYHLHLLLLIEASHRHEPHVSTGDLVGRWRSRGPALFPALILALREAGAAAGIPPDQTLGPALSDRLKAFDPVARAVVDSRGTERAAAIVRSMLGVAPVLLAARPVGALPPPTVARPEKGVE